MKVSEHERRDWAIIAVILLIGFLCVLLAGYWALRFSPSWKLAADMGSNLDPNSDFLTRRAAGFVEPVDPSVLTQPVWINVFLTPGAVFSTRTPNATATPTLFFTSTYAANATYTSVVLPSPTNTAIYLPPTATSISNPASTKTPIPAATITSSPTLIPSSTLSPQTDLQITKNDGTSTYTANGTLTYIVTVINNGPSNVIGAVITDNIPSQITSWNWICTSQSGGASGCSGMNGSTNFSNTVGLPVGSSITYTVNADISSTAAGDLINTASVNLPAGYTDSVPANNVSSDTDSPAIDLQITKTDGATTYTPGSTLTYTVVVTNNSTFNVNGAIVEDLLSAQISTATWTCSPSVGASCTSSGAGNVNDIVNIPAGLLVTYEITANTSPYAVGTLTNTASVTAPPGFIEIASGNNTATDSDTCATSEPGIGSPNNSWVSLPQGTSMVIVFSPAIVANGDLGTPDFVYYERRSTPTQIELDWVQVEISSDGNTWYEVFYWGDPGGSPDTNTNVDVQYVINDLCPTEIDNCVIPTTRLYNSTGITIDIDSIVPSGNYSWIRITSPVSPGGDNSEVDAVQPYYP